MKSEEETVKIYSTKFCKWITEQGQRELIGLAVTVKRQVAVESHDRERSEKTCQSSNNMEWGLGNYMHL